MGMPSASQVADNWARGMANSGEKLKQGIMAVTVSPTAKAADAADRMLAGVQRAIQSGKTQAALRAVSLEAWKDAAINKGANRVAGGAAAAKPKFTNFMQQFLPHLAAGMAQLDSMPRGDIEQNLARARAIALHNHNFKLSRQ